MKRFLLFALVATMFAACATDATEDVAVNIETPETLTVSLEEESRIQLQNGKTVWTAGDVVSVFYRSNANQKWQFQGETGERTAQLKRVDAGSATQTMQRVVIVYPYNTNYYINTETYNVEVSLPAEQTYLADSYGLNGNIMVSSSEYNQFALKSVCGWLKVQLTGKGEVVKSITLKGNNGEQVAGQLYVNSQDATAVLAADSGASSEEGVAGGSLVFDDTILTEVVLNCGEGVTLGTEPTAFYIALPPQTFEKGLTIDIKDSNDWTMTKSTDKAVTIERNTIQPMSPFEADIKPELSDYCLTAEFDVGGVGYFNNSNLAGDNNALVNIDYGDGSFGTERRHDYANAGQYTVKFYFEKPITVIGEQAFSRSSQLNSIVIPNTVVTIDKYAFYAWGYDYGHLKNGITFEEGSQLTTIKYCAFAAADMDSFIIPEHVSVIEPGAFLKCYKLQGFGVQYNSNYCNVHDSALLYSHDLRTLVAYAGGYEASEFLVSNVCEEIYDYTFSWNSYLEKIDMSWSKVVRLSSVANDCPKISRLKLPTTIEYISNSFNSCPAITEVYCEVTTPPTLESSFDSLSADAKIYVPYTAISEYKIAAGWSDFADKIVAYDFETNEIVEVQLKSEIWYTSTDGAIVTPNATNVFGANIVSNTYEDGKGIIKFDGDVTEIGDWAFSGCRTLRDITIPNSATYIGENAFINCSCLADVIIPNSVTEIRWCAFYGCADLESITLPDSITNVAARVFSECHNLKAFYGKFTSDDNRCLIVNGRLVSFASAGLTMYTIPNDVTLIANSAFSGCYDLEGVSIPNSVTWIDYYAFSGCKSLIDISIPESVNGIMPSAFNGCENLQKVCCNATTPPTGGSFMFDNCHSDLKIYVPAAAVDDYKNAAGWSDYADRIYTSLQIEIGQM